MLEITLALIALGTSLVVAVVQYSLNLRSEERREKNETELESLRNELRNQSAERDFIKFIWK